MRRTVLSLLSAAFFVCGCGQSRPAPESPPTAVLESPPPASGAPSASAGPEPAASPELAAGIKAFDARDYASARKSFEAAVQKSPANYEAQANLGMACEKLDDRPCAEAAYKAALAAKPDLESASTELTALYIDESRIEDAIAVARAGLAKHPDSAQLHENLGVALAMRGEQEGATNELSQAVKLQPSAPMFQLTFAHWLNAWKVRGAAPHLDAAREMAKDDYGLLAAIGFEYRLAGEFQACIKTFDHAIQIKDGGEVRTQRALCRHGMGDDKGMLDDLQAAVAKEPSYPTGHYYLGGRLAAARHFKEAAAEYAKYIELAPEGSLVKPARERLQEAQDAAKSAKRR